MMDKGSDSTLPKTHSKFIFKWQETFQLGICSIFIKYVEQGWIGSGLLIDYLVGRHIRKPFNRILYFCFIFCIDFSEITNWTSRFLLNLYECFESSVPTKMLKWFCFFFLHHRLYCYWAHWDVCSMFAVSWKKIVLNFTHSDSKKKLTLFLPIFGVKQFNKI